jgi:cytoskeletal protein CcmA (bactofilin family)
MKKEKKIASISTFLGSDASIEGTLEFQGTIRLDGRVKGKISSKDGTLIVGEAAVIHADITAGAIIVMGEVSGTINAVERLEVYPPGRVSGDIQAAIISIEPGGILNGNCTMKIQNTSSKKVPAPSGIASVSAGSK